MNTGMSSSALRSGHIPMGWHMRTAAARLDATTHSSNTRFVVANSLGWRLSSGSNIGVGECAPFWPMVDVKHLQAWFVHMV